MPIINHALIKDQEFFDKLLVLCKEYNATIESCGCCNSITVKVENTFCDVNVGRMADGKLLFKVEDQEFIL